MVFTGANGRNLITQLFDGFLFIYLLADPPGVARERKKKSIMKPTLHFLYVPADLKFYYQ